MNYIYDVLLNFDSMIFDHYEWNLNDNIYHIKKIPLFKVEEDVMEDAINYNLRFKQDFLSKIKNKTEIYLNRMIKPIEYAFVICNGDKVLALKLDSKGKTNRYSKMLISEELDTIENEDIIPYYVMDYEKEGKKNSLELKTKDEIKKTEYLKTKIKNSSKEQLEYLYYELYNEKALNVNVKNKLEKELKVWDDKANKMYEFFTLIANIK